MFSATGGLPFVLLAIRDGTQSGTWIARPSSGEFASSRLGFDERNTYAHVISAAGLVGRAYPDFSRAD